MHLFAQIEGELDIAIGKLFELEKDNSLILTASIDFFKKCNIVKTALNAQDDGSKEKAIREAFSDVARVNDLRQIVAHSMFEGHAPDGVEFRRNTAKGALKKEIVAWSEKDCDAHFIKMEQVRRDLHFLVQKIAPYKPSLDFSDPRNSMYLGMF
ncbi:hypothetical protein AOQ71_21190 [Bradyrhizobium manausense]|uniref:Uncharacterized protein n=1 Tax=Bradyrhizobium manausense TaxID=989370 RepID=A0A0R3DNG3_9BRAD|nr:hypothetical protein AOQ71_21190 [Bradyrhizobium manausense]